MVKCLVTPSVVWGPAVPRSFRNAVSHVLSQTNCIRVCILTRFLRDPYTNMVSEALIRDTHKDPILFPTPKHLLPSSSVGDTCNLYVNTSQLRPETFFRRRLQCRVIVTIVSHFCRPQTSSVDLQWKIKLDFPLNLVPHLQGFFNTLRRQHSQTLFITSPCVCFLNHQWCEPAQRHTEAARGRRISLTCQNACLFLCCTAISRPGCHLPEVDSGVCSSYMQEITNNLRLPNIPYGMYPFPPVTPVPSSVSSTESALRVFRRPSTPTVYWVPTACRAMIRALSFSFSFHFSIYVSVDLSCQVCSPHNNATA